MTNELVHVCKITVTRRHLRILIVDRGLSRLRDSRGGGASENIVALNGISGQVRVQVGDDGPGHILEVVVLDEYFCAHAGVDTRSRAVLVAVAVDMTGAEAERGET